VLQLILGYTVSILVELCECPHSSHLQATLAQDSAIVQMSAEPHGYGQVCMIEFVFGVLFAGVLSI
jgi:hypothetical protein